MNEQSWLDKEPQSDKRFTDEELKGLQQKYKHTEDLQEQRKDFFFMFKIMITVMFIFSYCLLFIAIKDSSSESAIISAIAIMVPLVLTLAMIRMLYADSSEKKDKSIPSITFNVGKELKSVFMAYFKKKID